MPWPREPNTSNPLGLDLAPVGVFSAESNLNTGSQMTQACGMAVKPNKGGTELAVSPEIARTHPQIPCMVMDGENSCDSFSGCAKGCLFHSTVVAWTRSLASVLPSWTVKEWDME